MLDLVRKSLAQRLGILVLALAGVAPALAADKPPLPVVPYVPTPTAVVDKMLEMAAVGKDDVVYDLGCGDGRIVITAARKHGARGVGIDLDPARIQEANENLAAANLHGRVKFVEGDLFKSDFSEATVVALYLLPEVNAALRPQLWKQLRPGTRVVSHAYDMGPAWPPERIEVVDDRPIFFWTIRPQHKKPG